MNFTDERYVRIYTRDTTNWLMLSWDAQCLLMLILRKLNRTGLIDLGRHGVDGLRAHLPKLPADRWDDYKRALTDELIGGEDPPLHLREQRYLVMPHFTEAQEVIISNAARQRAFRERQSDLAKYQNIVQSPSQAVTPTARHVTEDNDPLPSHPVTQTLRPVTIDDHHVTSDHGARNGRANGVTENNGACQNRNENKRTVTDGHSDPIRTSRAEPAYRSGSGARAHALIEPDDERSDQPQEPSRRREEISWDAYNARAREIMGAWEAIPGRTVLFANETAMRPLVEAIDTARASARERGEPFPDDLTLLTALHKRLKHLVDDKGYSNAVWQPGTMVKFLTDALLAISGRKASRSPRPRHGAYRDVEDLMAQAPKVERDPTAKAVLPEGLFDDEEDA